MKIDVDAAMRGLDPALVAQLMVLPARIEELAGDVRGHRRTAQEAAGEVAASLVPLFEAAANG